LGRGRSHQRKALAFHHPAEIGSTQRARLGRELAQLPIRHARKRLVHYRLFAYPGEVGEVLTHALRARPRRVCLGPVPAGPGCPRRHLEQGGQVLACCGWHRCGDPAAVTTVDHGACRAGEPQERAEGGQLAALAQQLFDAGIDDVGQIVPSARRLKSARRGPGRRVLCRAKAISAAAGVNASSSIGPGLAGRRG
jgi:hypothetical protein